MNSPLNNQDNANEKKKKKKEERNVFKIVGSNQNDWPAGKTKNNE